MEQGDNTNTTNSDSFYNRFWRYTFTTSSTTAASSSSTSPATIVCEPEDSNNTQSQTAQTDQSGNVGIRRALSFGNLAGVDQDNVPNSEDEEDDNESTTQLQQQKETTPELPQSEKYREKLEIDKMRPKSVDDFGAFARAQNFNSLTSTPTKQILTHPQMKKVGVTTPVPTNTKLPIIACKNEKDVKGGIQVMVQSLHSADTDIQFHFNGDTLYEKTLLATISRTVHEATHESESPFLAPTNLVSFSKHQPSPQLGWEKAATPMITRLSMIALPPFDYYFNAFPEEVFLLRTLHELRMQRHEMTTIPAKLGQLRALKILELPCNNVKYLPLELKYLQLLEYLDLSHNSIFNLPDGLSTLTNLKILKLSHNQLMTLPRELFEPCTLQIIHCSHNKLSRLPDNLGESLTALRELDLSHNALTLPFTTKKNEQLQCFQLSSLQKLLLNNNRITNLPQVKELVLLRELDISNNLLTSLPIGLNCLVNLTRLNASHNNINCLPDDLGGLRNVTEIDLSYNQLDCILPSSVKDLQHLKKLALSHNLLSNPSAFTVLAESAYITQSLQFLDLSYNKLTTLPAELSLLDSLETLDCSNNSISELPRAMFFNPPPYNNNNNNNETSDKEESPSDFYPPPPPPRRYFASLRLWDLSTNQLQSLPSEISVLPKIRYFNLSDNTLISLPSTLAHLTSLRKLQLHSKNLLVVSGSFPTSLNELSLAHIAINDHTKEVEVLPQTGIEYSVEFQLQLLLSLARSAPHPLTLFALAYFAERDEFKEAMVSQGELQDFLIFANSDFARNRLEAIRALANFLEHDEIQKKFWADGPNGIEILLRLAQDVEEEAATRVEAIRCIANFGFNGDNRKAFMEKYGLDMFIRMIESDDSCIKGEINRLLCIFGAHDYLHFGQPFQTRTNGIRILALDGGGARAFVTLEMIAKIEEITGCKMYELFDVICGTSTGAVLASMLGYQKSTAYDCEMVYRALPDILAYNGNGTTVKKMKKVEHEASDSPLSASTGTTSTTTSNSAGWYRFGNYLQFVKSGAYYRSGPIERVLSDCCGYGKMIDMTRDNETCETKIFVVSTEISNLPPEIYLWRNYNYPLNTAIRYIGTCRARVWQAARASTAAPSYFDEFKPPQAPNERHIDGAAVSNNPTGLAIHEAKVLWPNRPIDCVVSLGTGQCPAKPSTKGIQGLLSVILSAVVSSRPIDDVLSDLLPSSCYFRFDPLDESVACPLDERREEKWAELQQATRKYIAENEARFEELGEILLRGHPQFADRDKQRRRRLKLKRKKEKEKEEEEEKEKEKEKEKENENEEEKEEELQKPTEAQSEGTQPAEEEPPIQTEDSDEANQIEESFEAPGGSPVCLEGAEQSQIREQMQGANQLNSETHEK